MAETYGRVLLVSTVLPIAALSTWLLAQRRLHRAHALSLGVLLAVVYAATGPWDNIAVARGYWAFDRARTWGIWVFYLPVEEYLYFGLQTVLAALALFALLPAPARAAVPFARPASGTSPAPVASRENESGRDA